MKAYTSLNTRISSVHEPILGRQQVANNTGGFVYRLDQFKQMERFLILGSEGGSYYVGEQKLTRENAENVIKCIEADGKRAIDLIVAISDEGRAVKNDPALFALALAASAKDAGTRAYALAALPKVARIPTHLFHFLTYVQQFRGWGRALKRAVAEWYNSKPVEELAYQVVKYQSRDGFSNRDALRLAHPKTEDEVRNILYNWIVDGIDLGRVEGADIQNYKGPLIVSAFEFAKRSGTNTNYLVSLIRDYNLSREMLPTEALTKPEVWEALLEKMPPHALLRNLGNMSKVGLLKPLSNAANTVVDKLSGDRAAQSFAKNRVHPVAILIAMKQYAAGHGLRGAGVWTPVPAVVDALDEAFYNAFKFVEPTGKRFLFGVDVSGSMGWASIPSCNMTCAEGAAAMALAVAKVEKTNYIMGFADTFRDLGITPKMRLTDALQRTNAMRFGSTNCSLPTQWALKNKVEVDCFIIITDNEVNTGPHPSQSLQQYRDKMGINAKQVVIAMTPTKFSIADPNDPFQTDVAGFDSSVPQAVQEFARL